MASGTHKRQIVACDGTWVNSDNGAARKSWFSWKPEYTLQNSSNVTRICRALLPRSDDGIQQIVYYQGGLGSANSFWSYLFGGYLGTGIDENIREAYAFLCNNYIEGDEIHLIGFSRGAFTARSIGGLISSIGILTKHGLGAFYPIFKDWEHQSDKKYKPAYQTGAWPLIREGGKPRPSFKDPDYLKLLRQGGLTSQTIPTIKAIGVWDTVGTLGVPTLKIFGIPVHTDSTHEYSFVNTEVAPNVEHAYHALALDEVRSPFSPTIWESPSPGGNHVLKELKQTWFPGVHTSVGGGYADTSISDITLAWMITQLSPLLAFDRQYVKVQRTQNEAFYARIDKDKTGSVPVPVRGWALGLIRRSDAGVLNTITGRSVRMPGEYHPTDPDTGKILPRKMRKTHEFVHPSVRYRILAPGMGLANSENDYVGKGRYYPTALNAKDWRYVPAGDKSGLDVAGKEWEDSGKWVVTRENGDVTFIVEESIENGTAEMDLLQGWKEGWLGVKAVLDKDVE